MRKFLILSLLIFSSSLFCYSQVDSSTVQKEEIKKQAIELRNKVNDFVNQSTSKSSATSYGPEIDSLFIFMVDFKRRYKDLELTLDSVKNKQSELIYNNLKLQRKLEVFKDYPDLPAQFENDDKKKLIIYFKSASTNIDNVFKSELSDWLKSIPKNSKITIWGFADDLGNSKQNQVLSLKRANETQKILNQISAGSLQSVCIGKGELKVHSAQNKNTSRQLNRKVVLFY